MVDKLKPLIEQDLAALSDKEKEVISKSLGTKRGKIPAMLPPPRQPPSAPINPTELAVQAILISLTSHIHEELIDVISAECKEIIHAAKLPEMQKYKAIDQVLNILGRLRPPNETKQ